ncbi:hypothetical protein GCM10027612_22880 [Microbispora bryophytorum subsp. camponoti]
MSGFCTTGSAVSGSALRSCARVGTASLATVPDSSRKRTGRPGLTARPHRGSGQPAASSASEVILTRGSPVAARIASTDV